MRPTLAALALALALPAAAALPAPVAEALARARVPASAVAAMVVSVDGGVPAVAHREHEPMNPASVMKVVTSAAALDLLGPAFTFHTDVRAVAPLEAGVLQGDLFIRGGGDPRLTYERLWQLVRGLRARGVREIRGDVVIDRSYFAPVSHDTGRFDGEPRRAYNVGPDPFLVNFGVVDFRFLPDGEGVRVIPEPDLPSLEVLSHLATTRDACGAWRRGVRYDVVDNGMLSTIDFAGRYPADCGEKTWPLAVMEATRFAEAMWRWLWAEAGGTLRGKVRGGPVPPEARLLLRFDSEPLPVLVRDMNKFSNNVMARHVFLALSAERGGVGEAQASARIVQDWLASRGIEARELVLENGSGLSRTERASAATLAAVLRAAWLSPTMPELMSSFPLFAVDGTFKSRRAGAVAGQAHLKGGTLDGVQSEAGYVLDRRGRRWIVVMIVNHANAQAAQPALDALAEWVGAR